MRRRNVATEAFRIKIVRRAIGGRRSVHWEIYREADSMPISTSFMVYSTEKEARLDAELELARLLRPAPQPDEY
jgi:hypothetical protein